MTAVPETSALRQHPTDGPIHTWFGLTYSNYQVLHRTLMQSMPIEWQERMVACLEELQSAYWHLEQPECFEVTAATEHIVNEMGDAQLKQAGIVQDWYRGETPPDGLDAQDLAEWKEAHEDPEGPAYSRDGEELDGHERVLLPAVDPIQHYNRGRTYIEPQLSDFGKAADQLFQRRIYVDGEGDPWIEIPRSPDNGTVAIVQLREGTDEAADAEEIRENTGGLRQIGRCV